ncbi:Wall-associated receptor kinase 3 [Camellia lanceoleosa]|uniref:Wall-associated receptor kinase 3 n=1 Tax=Camellia lanceoleosa TaxID=1840588 RepID=A0ACC0FRP7_9ERIC|nr:Wall-associated receptor kinase 3 [Camellia lanceoleosa]
MKKGDVRIWRFVGGKTEGEFTGGNDTRKSSLSLRALVLSELCDEYKGKIQFLSHGLHERVPGSVHNGSLSWKSRLSIANDIASALVYLHTAFSTPIVHRNLKPSIFIVDQGGVAKLLDFSLSILIPLGESQVEDMLVGTYGFAEPEYIATGILTRKTDVTVSVQFFLKF